MAKHPSLPLAVDQLYRNRKIPQSGVVDGRIFLALIMDIKDVVNSREQHPELPCIRQPN